MKKKHPKKNHDEIVIKIIIQEHDEDEQEDEGCGPGEGGGSGPIATPFLVIPAGPGDDGQRPLPLSQAISNQGILSPIVIGLNWNDISLQLLCVVSNAGAVGSTGLAEFYVGDQFSIWYPGHEGLTPAQVQANAQLIGRTTFVVPPGATITVACQQLWKPGNFEAAQKGVLVQISDPITDPLTRPFDAVNDRHVARNDEIMDPVLF